MFDSPLLEAQRLKARLAEVAAGITALASANIGVFTDAEVLEFTEHLERLRPTLDAVSATALTHIEASGAAISEAGMRPAQWLAHTTKIPHRDARRRFSTAATITTVLPAVGDALREGRINLAHADHLAKVTNPRNAAAMGDAAADMCERAQTRTFGRWAREVSFDAEMYDEDGAHDPDADAPTSKLNMSRSGDLLRLSGDLFGPLGRLVETALSTVTDEVFKDLREHPDLALNVAADGTTTPMTTPQIRAEALGRLAERGLGVELGASRGPRDAVTLVLNPAEPHMVTDASGHIVNHRDYGAVLCDPTFHPLVMSINGVPLDAGRDARYANREQRRAAAHRDGGCVFPGCGMPAAWTDAHHVEEWGRDHGATDIMNLACLCRFHHGVVHRNGWSMATAGDGWFTFTTPTGETMGSQRHEMTRAGPAPGPP